jgi:hypothetical protein
VRQVIVEEIAREGSEAYTTGLIAAAMLLKITLAELQSILDENSAVWSTEEIPKHLLAYKRAHPDEPVDPDIPPLGAVIHACVFLQSESLPLSLVYRYFTNQYPLHARRPVPALNHLFIDCADRSTNHDLPTTPTSSASESSLEWCPGREGPEFNYPPRFPGRRASSEQSRRSIGLEVIKATQECLPDRNSIVTLPVPELDDGKSRESFGRHSLLRRMNRQRANAFPDSSRQPRLVYQDIGGRRDSGTSPKQPSTHSFTNPGWDAHSANALGALQGLKSPLASVRQANNNPRPDQQPSQKPVNLPRQARVPPNLQISAVNLQRNQAQMRSGHGPKASPPANVSAYEGRADGASMLNAQGNPRMLLSPYASPSQGREIQGTRPQMHNPTLSPRARTAGQIQAHSASAHRQQLAHQPSPTTAVKQLVQHSLAQASPSSRSMPSEPGIVAAQLACAADQEEHLPQRIGSSRPGITSTQGQYRGLRSPLMSEGKQHHRMQPLSPSSKWHDSLGGSYPMQSPYQGKSPALPAPSQAGLPPFPYQNDAAPPSSKRVLSPDDKDRDQGLQMAQSHHVSPVDPFIGPQISRAVGPYFKTPNSTNYFTTSLPHQTGSTIYPSLSQSPPQDIRYQHLERNDQKNRGHSLPSNGLGSKDQAGITSVSVGGESQSKVEVSSVAQVESLLKNDERNRGRVRRGQSKAAGMTDSAKP